MSDAREAREKLRNLDYRGLGNWYTPDGLYLDAEEVNDLRATVAMHSLEEHPADEGEALSVEDLISESFEITYFGEFWMATLRRIGFLLRVSKDGSCYIRSNTGAIDWPVPIATRGQLRQLMSALGIGK